MLAPVVAGYLFQAGFGLQFVAVVMGCGALVAACLLYLLKERAAEQRGLLNSSDEKLMSTHDRPYSITMLALMLLRAGLSKSHGS